jgi:hypothetical protein
MLYATNVDCFYRFFFTNRSASIARRVMPESEIDSIDKERTKRKKKKEREEN